MSTYSTVNPVVSSRIPPGTEVEFSRMMNPNFAIDYVNADITTKAVFLSSSFPEYNFGRGEIPTGYFPFKVAVPEGSESNIVFAPNHCSDFIFSLKPGELIKLSGGTLVREFSLFTKISTYGLSGKGTRVFFKATDCSKQLVASGY